MFTDTIRIELLASHPETLPILKLWFETEWSAWYGPGGSGDAEADLITYSNRNSVPFGMVAYRSDEPCGFAVLKSEAISGHAHLSPWAGAAFVVPHLRNRGIGTQLLSALEFEAKNLGYAHVYCGTTQAGNLLSRSGWREMSQVWHNGENVSVYAKAL